MNSPDRQTFEADHDVKLLMFASVIESDLIYHGQTLVLSPGEIQTVDRLSTAKSSPLSFVHPQGAQNEIN